MIKLCSIHEIAVRNESHPVFIWKEMQLAGCQSFYEKGVDHYSYMQIALVLGEDVAKEHFSDIQISDPRPHYLKIDLIYECRECLDFERVDIMPVIKTHNGEPECPECGGVMQEGQQEI